MINIILVILYLIFSVSGILLMKAGNIIFLGEGAFSEYSININVLSIAGMVSYVVSFLLWVVIIPRFDLSYIVPIAIGVGQVFILLASLFIFKETVSTIQFIGIAAILVGIILLNIK